MLDGDGGGRGWVMYEGGGLGREEVDVGVFIGLSPSITFTSKRTREERERITLNSTCSGVDKLQGRLFSFEPKTQRWVRGATPSFEFNQQQKKSDTDR